VGVDWDGSQGWSVGVGVGVCGCGCECESLGG